MTAVFFSRLSSPILSSASSIFRPFPLISTPKHQVDLFSAQKMLFHTTPVTSSLPGKKKRLNDPMILKNREEKRMNRLRKALRKMEKKKRIPRPLIEHEVSPHIQRELATRDRGVKVAEDVVEERALIFKEWNRYCFRRAKAEVYALDSLIISQYRALEELRAESEELYLEAIQFDPDLVPFKGEGPSQTPPIPEYIQDGTYDDVTKKFQVKYGDMKDFLKKLTQKTKKKKKKVDEEEQ